MLVLVVVIFILVVVKVTSSDFIPELPFLRTKRILDLSLQQETKKKGQRDCNEKEKTPP